MRKPKKLTALLLALTLLFACAACGSGNDVKKTEPGTAAQSTSGTPDADLSWEEIQTNGKLVIGLDDTFAPMGFLDEAGTLVGFDIDLATADIGLHHISDLSLKIAESFRHFDVQIQISVIDGF